VPSFIRQRNILGEPYGWADVALVLDSNGAVQSVRVLTSSGSSMLDQAALTSGRLSRYSAERSACVAHGGTYALHVDFDG
jgi:TonB family protein